jgi:predicted RNase H-like HicB family nuclease
MRYGLVIYWSKADSTFVVEVPELPGGMADGATYEEAVANAQVIISEWLGAAVAVGRPIPEPKGKLDFVES